MRTTMYSLMTLGLVGVVATFSGSSSSIRSLLSSSSSSSSSSSFSSLTSDDFLVGRHEEFSHKCNPEVRTLELIKAFNEGRFDDVAGMYTEDALRFSNGLLDVSSKGRPFTAEQWYSLREQTPMKIEPRMITRSGDWAVAVAGTMLIGGDVEPAEGMGYSFVLEFRHKDRCLIQVERVVHGHDSAAFEKFLEASCAVFPELELRDMCVGLEGPDSEPVDLIARYRECWEFIANDEPASIAGCFLPTTPATINGDSSSVEIGNINYWATLMGAIDLNDVTIEHVTQSGDTVWGLVSGVAVDKSGKYGSVNFYTTQELTGNRGGEFTVFEEVANGEYIRFGELVLGESDLLDAWTNENARGAVLAAIEVLGFPSELYNTEGFKHAIWYPDALTEWPMDRVYAYDESYQHAEHGDVHEDPLTCEAIVAVSDGAVEDVRSFSKSLVYDQLADKMYSQGYSVGTCMLEQYYVRKIASGEMTVAEVIDVYAEDLGRIANTQGTFFQEVKTYLMA